MPPIPPEYAPMRQAASELGTTYWIVRGMIKSGRIRFLRVPGRGYRGMQFYVHTGDLRQALRIEVEGNPPPEKPEAHEETPKEK